MLKSPITEKDWLRFDRYANRVRYLAIDFTLQTRRSVCTEIYLEIAQSRRILFPALLNLHAISASNSTPELVLMCSPLLREVNISVILQEGGIETGCSLKRFWDGLGHHSPQLQCLSITGHITSFACADIISLHQLRFLDISGLHPMLVELHILNYLCHFQDLVELRIFVSPISECDSQPPAPLKSLEKLTIRGHISSIPLYLIKLRAPFLKELEIQFSTLPLPINLQLPAINDYNLTLCFDMVAECFSSLQSLQFCSVQPLSFEARISVNVSCIQPLLKLSHIKCFRFWAFPSLSISDEDIVVMASAWPKIVSLQIPHTNSLTTPTLVGLEHLSRHCPHLKTLEMTINTQNKLPDSSSTEVLTHGLQHFCPFSSSVRNPVMVARYLDQMFPNLEAIDFKTSGQHCEGWRKVDEMIRDLVQPARREQQRRDFLVMNAVIAKNVE